MCTGTGTEVQKGTGTEVHVQKGTVPVPGTLGPATGSNQYIATYMCTKVAIHYFLELVRVLLNISSSL